MLSSDGLACPVCGEARDITRIDWGCVVCNPDKRAAAHRPEVPVNPGPDGLGCIAHHELNCERCHLIETRHRLAIESWEADSYGEGYTAPRSGGGLTLAVIVLVAVLLAAGCLWYAISSWPSLPY